MSKTIYERGFRVDGATVYEKPEKWIRNPCISLTEPKALDGVCQNCHERPATVNWTGDGGTMAYIHGMYSRWCELCSLRAQLAHAQERAVAIPELQRRILEEEQK